MSSGHGKCLLSQLKYQHRLVISNELYSILISCSQNISPGWYFYAFYSLSEICFHFLLEQSDFYAMIHLHKKISFQLRLPITYLTLIKVNYVWCFTVISLSFISLHFKTLNFDLTLKCANACILKLPADYAGSVTLTSSIRRKDKILVPILTII